MPLTKLDKKELANVAETLDSIADGIRDATAPQNFERISTALSLISGIVRSIVKRHS